MKKKLFAKSLIILLSLFAGFIINLKNTNAVGYNVELTPVNTYNLSWQSRYKYQSDSSWTDINLPFTIPLVASKAQEQRFFAGYWSTNSIDIVKDHYYESILILVSRPTDPTVTSSQPLGYITSLPSSNDFQFIHIEELYKFDDPNLYTFYQQQASGGLSLEWYNSHPEYRWQFKAYSILVKAKNTKSTNLMFGTRSDTMIAIPGISAPSDWLDVRMVVYGAVNEFVEAPNDAAEELKKQNEKDDEDRENLESQQENNESDAEDTKDEANTTGTTLMGAFSALITALGNVHSTNCKLPNMQVYTLQLKNMDLCTVNMPSGISALGGIAVSLLIVKLGISLVKRMLALYKEIIG